MKREIKFRGKDIENDNQWRYGSLIQYPSGDCVIVEFDKDGNELSYNVDPKTVGQYTGMKDGCGRDIYERDILQLTIPDGSTRWLIAEWAEENRKLMPLDGFEHDGNPIRISGWCFKWNGYRLYPSVINGTPDNKRMIVVANIFYAS